MCGTVNKLNKAFHFTKFCIQSLDSVEVQVVQVAAKNMLCFGVEPKDTLLVWGRPQGHIRDPKAQCALEKAYIARTLNTSSVPRPLSVCSEIFSQVVERL